MKMNYFTTLAIAAAAYGAWWYYQKQQKALAPSVEITEEDIIAYDEAQLNPLIFTPGIVA